MTGTVEIIFIVLPIILLSISLHEAMHALASHWLGDDSAYREGRVTLNPLQHIDPVLTVALPLLLALLHQPIFAVAKPVQVNFYRLKYREFGGAIVAAAGPLTNMLLAILFAGLLNLLQPSSYFIYDFLSYGVLINAGLFVFNSIPWPPLDGSRVLYAFAPRPLQELMDSIEQMGIASLLIFMLIFYQFISPVVANIIAHIVNGLSPGLI